MKAKFFIVNQYCEIIPCAFHSWQDAMAMCDYGESVFMADSLEFLESALEQVLAQDVELDRLF